MRFHLRFPEDDWVDRPELEAQQCVEATGTNTPNKPTPGFSTNQTQNETLFASTMQSLTQHTHCHNDISILIITITSTLKMCRWLIAAGKRPVPFRTRKLSPPAPMVLLPGGSGRVGYRRPNNFTTLKHPGPTAWLLLGVFHAYPPLLLVGAHPPARNAEFALVASAQFLTVSK